MNKVIVFFIVLSFHLYCKVVAQNNIPQNPPENRFTLYTGSQDVISENSSNATVRLRVVTASGTGFGTAFFIPSTHPDYQCLLTAGHNILTNRVTNGVPEVGTTFIGLDLGYKLKSGMNYAPDNIEIKHSLDFLNVEYLAEKGMNNGYKYDYALIRIPRASLMGTSFYQHPLVGGFPVIPTHETKETGHYSIHHSNHYPQMISYLYGNNTNIEPATADDARGQMQSYEWDGDFSSGASIINSSGIAYGIYTGSPQLFGEPIDSHAYAFRLDPVIPYIIHNCSSNQSTVNPSSGSDVNYLYSSVQDQDFDIEDFDINFNDSGQTLNCSNYGFDNVFNKDCKYFSFSGKNVTLEGDFTAHSSPYVPTSISGYATKVELKNFEFKPTGKNLLFLSGEYGASNIRSSRSVKENESKNNLDNSKVMANHVLDKDSKSIKFFINSNQKEKWFLSIYDSKRNSVLNDVYTFEGNSFTIDLNNLHSGVYYYVLRSSNKVIKKGKFIY